MSNGIKRFTSEQLPRWPERPLVTVHPVMHTNDEKRCRILTIIYQDRTQNKSMHTSMAGPRQEIFDSWTYNIKFGDILDDNI